jgi:hypothetical protein
MRRSFLSVGLSSFRKGKEIQFKIRLSCIFFLL